MDGLQEAVEIAQEAAGDAGLPDARVTSDAKHVEIGLTDKADAARWVFDDLLRRGIGAGLVLVAGDEFGPLGGLPGSDSLLLVPEAERATAVSVGAEPTGTPPGVIALGGGPDAFLALLEDQLERRRKRDVPQVDADADWTLTVDGFDQQLARVHESLLAVADGRVGIRGAPALDHPGSERAIFVAGAYEGEGPELRSPHSTTGRASSESSHPIRCCAAGSISAPACCARISPFPQARCRCSSSPARPARHGRPSRVGAQLGGAFRTAGSTGSRSTASDEGEKATRLAAAKSAGFEALLAEHRDAWARRWEEADVVIEGDPELQRAVHFAPSI